MIFQSIRFPDVKKTRKVPWVFLQMGIAMRMKKAISTPRLQGSPV